MRTRCWQCLQRVPRSLSWARDRSMVAVSTRLSRNSPMGRDDLVLDQAAVTEHGALGDLALAGSPFAPGVQQLGHGLVAGGPVLAGPGFPDQPGFQLAGLGSGLGRAGRLALLAGERIATGVDDDPPAVAALLDHPAGPPAARFLPKG